MTEQPKLEDYPSKDYDKLRYSDMDTQGHVNNAVFTTLLETGRTTLLNHPSINAWQHQQHAYVIARLEVDYRAELRWPGLVHIGTGILSVGKSSVVLAQALFKDDICVVTAQCVMVQVDKTTHRPSPIGEETRAILAGLMLKPAAST
jgi:acyl-CoA thioester hydrolase